MVAPVGSKKKPAAFCKNTTQLMGIIIKQCLRTEQDTRFLCGALFDTVIMATEHDVVKSMREQTRLYNETRAYRQLERGTRWAHLRFGLGED